MKRVLCLVVSLGCLGIALGGAAFARGPGAGAESEAKAYLELGLKLFGSGNFRGAQGAYARAHALVPERAQPFRLLGLVEALLGECRAAVEHLEGFIARVPAGDPRVPEAVEVRDRCKAQLGPKLGTLAVRSRPDGAEVRLDDETAAPIGVTPLVRPEVAAGAHVVYLRKAGHVARSRGFTVEPGGTAEVELELEVAKPPVRESAAGPGPKLDRTPATRARTMRITGLVLGLVSLGEAAAGIYFSVVARDRRDDLAALYQRGGGGDLAATLADEQRSAVINASILYGISGALLVTGVTLYLVGWQRGRAAPPALSVGLLPHGGGITWAVRF